MALYRPTPAGNQAFTDGTFFTDGSGFAEPQMVLIQRLRFVNTPIQKLYIGSTRVFGVVAPTHVTTTASTSSVSESTSVTIPFTVPNGVPNGFLVLWLFFDSQGTPEANSATWRGTAMTKATGISATHSSGHRIQCFYKTLPAAGSGNIVANHDFVGRLTWVASLYRNVTPAFAIAAQYSVQSAFTVSFSFNGTRGDGNRVITAGMHSDTTGSFATLGAGTRLHGVRVGAHQSFSGYLNSTDAGAFSATWTAGNNEVTGDPGAGQWVLGGLQLNHD